MDDDQPGYGRRKRSLPERKRNETSSSQRSSEFPGIHDWTRDFELNVVMPGYAKGMNQFSSIKVFNSSFQHSP